MRWILTLAAAVSFASAETKQFTAPDGCSYTYDYTPADASQPTFLLIHGYPSGRHDWRHQVANLTASGYGVLAPDCLGYGDSDAPLDVEEYNLKTIAGHFDAILDNESLESVIGVGHDWGTSVLSSAAVYHPERFHKLAFLAGSYSPPGPFDVDAINAQSLEQVGYTRFGYWYFFNAFDAVDVISEHLSSFFSLAFPPDPAIWRDNLAPLAAARAWLNVNTTTALAAYLTEEDKTEWLRRYSTPDAIAASLNYYRSIFAGVQVLDAADSELNPVLTVPVMTIAGTLDAITSAEDVEAVTGAFASSTYRAEVVQSGHWVMLEQAEEVNAYLNDFAAEEA